MSDYFSAPGVNWSLLKHMRDSPAAFRYAAENKRADADFLALGRYLHALVLEPETVDDAFVVWDGGVRRGKEWQAFSDEHAHRTIIKADDAEIGQAMAASINSNPIAVEMLAGGLVESPVYWTDPETGLRCKAKPDSTNQERRLLVDLKTTRSVDGRRFGAEAARFLYSHQMAHYEAGCAHGLGWTPDRVIIIAVEKTPPFDVGVFEIDAMAREIASVEVAALLRRLKECQDTDEWPGRYSEIQALQLPAWVYSDDDEDDADGFGLVIGG